MRKSVLRLVVLSSPLLLTACGEGWEMQRTSDVFPYGNERTAGTGVAYVRAKMLPKKELKVETMVEEKTIIEPEPDPVLDAEEIFTETQTKGRSSNKIKTPKEEKHSSAKVGNSEAEALVSADPSKSNDQVVLASISEINPMAGDDLEIELAVIEQEAGSLFNEEETEVYENKVSQPLKHIVVPKKDFFDFRSAGKKSLDEIYQDEFKSPF